MLDLEKLLTKKQAIVREIRVYEKLDSSKPIYFNQLVNELTKRELASRSTISHNLAELTQSGIVEAIWKRRGTAHVRELRISAKHEEHADSLVQEFPHPLLEHRQRVQPARR